MIWWTAVAVAAPVVCDPVEAARIVDEARIELARVPVTHPHLVPGLALGGEPPAELREVLTALCTSGVTVRSGPSWRSPDGAAYVVDVSRAEREDCWLVQRRASVSVGIGRNGVVYDLLRAPSVDRTGLPGCAGPSEWQENVVLAGGEGPVRLIREVAFAGETVARSAIVVLRASAQGWRRELLAEPAPPSGVHLAPVGGAWWVVACRTGVGQTVWRPGDDGAYESVSGRAALGVLARAGLWRMAGTEGWFLILAQGEAHDASQVTPRLRRLQRQQAEALHLYPSSAFPELNPGYLFVAQDPWPSREGAEAARRGRRGPYVKRGWTTSSCEGEATLRAGPRPSVDADTRAPHRW